MTRKRQIQDAPVEKCGTCRHARPITTEHLNNEGKPILCHCSLIGLARLMGESACKRHRR